MSRRKRLILIVAAIAVAALALAIGSMMFRAKSAGAPLPAEAPAKLEESAKAAEAPPEPAPPRPALLVEDNGVRRVSCAGACALEKECGLRSVDACERESCDDTKTLRVPNRSDFCMAEQSVAGTCADVVVCTCEEACWKKGECTGDHKDDGACTAACKKLVEQDPVATYRDNRCALENSCADIAACGVVDARKRTK